MVVLCAALPLVAAPPDQPLSSPPTVQVLLLFDPLLGYTGVVSYTAAVSRDQAKAELEVLADALGYESAADLRPFDPDTGRHTDLGYARTERGSELTFRTSEKFLDREHGTLRLEPLIRAYGHYRRINLEYLISDLNGRAFAYHGPGNYESDQVRLRHQGGTGHHAFQVEVLDPAFESLDLPPYAPPEEPLTAESNSRRGPADMSARRRIGAVVLGIGLSLLVYLLLFGLLTRRGSATKPRRRRWHR